MNTFFPWKYFWLGLALSMVIFALRYRPIVRAPAVVTYTHEAARSPLPEVVHNTIHKIHRKALHLMAKRFVKTMPPPQDWMTFHLKPNVHDYNYIMSGQTFCGKQPCAANLDVVMESTNNPNVHRAIHTTEDGSFWLQIPMTEASQEQVDWKIVAHTVDGRTADAHGRQILTDDTVVPVETNLNLH